MTEIDAKRVESALGGTKDNFPFWGWNRSFEFTVWKAIKLLFSLVNLVHTEKCDFFFWSTAVHCYCYMDSNAYGKNVNQCELCISSNDTEQLSSMKCHDFAHRNDNFLETICKRQWDSSGTIVYSSFFSFKKFNYCFSRHVFKVLKILIYFLHTSGTKIQAKFCVIILFGKFDQISLGRSKHRNWQNVIEPIC